MPESAVELKALKFPKRKGNSSDNNLNADQKREMREWASVNGAVVRQRSSRQETTMARAGTLPENAYFQELRPLSAQEKNSGDASEEEINEELTEDEIPEYESDSDVGMSSDDEEFNDTVDTVSNVALFLVGASSRYGRSITFNKKYVS